MSEPASDHHRGSVEQSDETGDDERQLIVDMVAVGFWLGDQLIGLTPVALADFA